MVTASGSLSEQFKQVPVRNELSIVDLAPRHDLTSNPIIQWFNVLKLIYSVSHSRQ